MITFICTEEINQNLVLTGKIQWARCLFLHLEEPMMFFKDHPVLLKMPEGKEAVKKYNRIGKMLVQYELAFYDAWRRQSVCGFHNYVYHFHVLLF